MEYICHHLSIMASTRLQQRIDPKLRKDAEMILKAQGIKPSQAIILFYMEVKRTGGLPFAPTPVAPEEIPNARLQKELRDAAKGKGVKTYKNAEEMFASLHKL